MLRYELRRIEIDCRQVHLCTNVRLVSFGTILHSNTKFKINEFWPILWGSYRNYLFKSLQKLQGFFFNQRNG